MHSEAKHFLTWVKTLLPEYFEHKSVLDVGSADINGTTRDLFDSCVIVGNDILPHNNVDIVCKTKDLSYPDEVFDTIISSECFEHDETYEESLQKIVQLLKPDGLFLFTCASVGRKEHGTARTSPADSLTARTGSNYYKNLTAEDIKQAIPIPNIFSYYQFFYNMKTADLYFFGIKHGQQNIEFLLNDDYDALGVSAS